MRYTQEIKHINAEHIGVMPTDTLYGIVASAFSKKAVEKIYHLKHRDLKKPLIVLIGDIDDLKKFNIPFRAFEETTKKYWPGPISIILPCEDETFSYLHRGTNSIAFRLPNPEWLQTFLRETGPLVAPSANPEGLPPAKNVEEAKNYFADSVSFYIDHGTLTGNPSTIINLLDDEEKIIR
jgi:L-threonylcarbamoyladenylate synthase